VPWSRGEAIFVSAGAMVGKVILGTGVYAWKHSDLRDPYGELIVAFDQPALDGPRAVYPLFQPGILHPWPAATRPEVVVDDASGELLSPRFSGTEAAKYPQ